MSRGEKRAHSVQRRQKRKERRKPRSAEFLRAMCGMVDARTIKCVNGRYSLTKLGEEIWDLCADAKLPAAADELSDVELLIGLECYLHLAEQALLHGVMWGSSDKVDNPSLEFLGESAFVLMCSAGDIKDRKTQRPRIAGLVQEYFCIQSEEETAAST